MWNLYSNEREGFWGIYDENKNIVALINQKNINKNSKFNTSLILNSKDLYDFVNSIKDLQDNDIKKIKKEASLLISNINDLSSIKVGSTREKRFPVAYIDVNTDKLMYSKTGKLSDFIFFDEIFNSKGFLSFNIYVDNLDNSFMVLNRFVLSSSVAESIISKLSDKYNFITDFISEFEKSNLNSISDFTYNIIDEFISADYEKEMSLYDYLFKYPLLDNDNSLINIKYTPSVLSDCSFSIHPLLNVNYGSNEQAEGMLFYSKQSKKYYIYNLSNKELIFTTINNDDRSLKEVNVRFIDFIQA